MSKKKPFYTIPTTSSLIDIFKDLIIFHTLHSSLKSIRLVCKKIIEMKYEIGGSAGSC